MFAFLLINFCSFSDGFFQCKISSSDGHHESFAWLEKFNTKKQNRQQHSNSNSPSPSPGAHSPNCVNAFGFYFMRPSLLPTAAARHQCVAAAVVTQQSTNKDNNNNPAGRQRRLWHNNGAWMPIGGRGTIGGVLLSLLHFTLLLMVFAADWRTTHAVCVFISFLEKFDFGTF